MKAVLISIRPEWCEKIVNGEKTIEVRKTRPKLNPPFKCYIYCTKHPKGLVTVNRDYKVCNQKVIGEFVCDRIYQYTTSNGILGSDISTEDMVEGSCLTEQELHDYDHSVGPNGYRIALWLSGWHISDLVIYDEPIPLSEFNGWQETILGPRYTLLTHPPQSWCYVSSLEK